MSETKQKKNVDIKILIAAHKESVLPENKLFYPIEVGAAQRSSHLKGYQRDDEGDNISEKNANYSELTAIYWGWKNIKADYCGLFHYRRFLSFSDTRFKVSDDGRKMVHIPFASEEVFAKYGLNNEAKMRELIEKNDIVVAESQDVSEIYTPKHYRRHSVYKHWIDHDDMIIKVEDIDKTLSIAKKNYPEVAKYIDKYMNGKWFLGYNMFIMKKPLYDEMCDFIFSTLFELEAQVDISNYGKQMSRIYGYMAEILSSIYIYYLRQSRPSLKVSERQMLFFDETDESSALLPSSERQTILFNLDSIRMRRHIPLLFMPVFEKFANSVSGDSKKYDVIIAHRSMDNDGAYLLQRLVGKYGGTNINIKLLDIDLAIQYHNLEKFFNFDFMFLAPWILSNYKKITIFKWHTWFNDNTENKLQEINDIDLGEKMIAAPYDVFRLGQTHDVNKAEREYVEKTGLDPESLFDFSVAVLNLDKIRSTMEIADIKNAYSIVKDKKRDTFSNDVAGIVFNGEIKPLDFDLAAQMSTDFGMEYIMSLAPLRIYEDYSVKKGRATVRMFKPKFAITPEYDDFYLEYINIMLKLGLYPLYVNAFYRNNKTSGRSSMVDILAPKNSLRRNLARKLVPYGSKRQEFIRRLKNRIVG